MPEAPNTGSCTSAQDVSSGPPVNHALQRRRARRPTGTSLAVTLTAKRGCELSLISHGTFLSQRGLTAAICLHPGISDRFESRAPILRTLARCQPPAAHSSSYDGGQSVEAVRSAAPVAVCSVPLKLPTSTATAIDTGSWSQLPRQPTTAAPPQPEPNRIPSHSRWQTFSHHCFRVIADDQRLPSHDVAAAPSRRPTAPETPFCAFVMDSAAVRGLLVASLDHNTDARRQAELSLKQVRCSSPCCAISL